MLEILTKYIGATKIIHLPLFLMTIIKSSDGLKIERNDLNLEDDVPGDNFPYVVMNPNKVH